MLTKVLRAEGEDDRVADGLEEEEGEEAADTGSSGCEGGGEAEDGAGDAVEAEQKGGVYKVEQDDTDKSVT